MEWTQHRLLRREDGQSCGGMNTFEAGARDWLKNAANKRAEVAQSKITKWLEKDTFPALGTCPSRPSGPRTCLTGWSGTWRPAASTKARIKSCRFARRSFAMGRRRESSSAMSQPIVAAH